MFQGKLVYNTRQKLNLTQAQLADGTCTQNTISKLENHNIAPTAAILVRICERLGLTLNDLFTEFSQDPKYDINIVLNDIEQEIYNKNYRKVTSKLKVLNKLDIEDTNPRICLIKSFLDLNNNDLDKASFQTDLILNNINLDEQKSLLVMIGFSIKGFIYAKKGLIKSSEYYYDRIFSSITNITNAHFDNLDTKRFLYLCKSCSLYYMENDSMHKAEKIANLGLIISKEKHTSIFVEYFYFVLSNCEKINKNEYLHLAETFSKFNSNDNYMKDMNGTLGTS